MFKNNKLFGPFLHSVFITFYVFNIHTDSDIVTIRFQNFSKGCLIFITVYLFIFFL